MLVAALVATSAMAAFSATRQVVDDTERRLLHDRAQDVRGLLESLSTGYEGEMSTVAAVAQVTGGDAGEFRVAVGAAAEAAARATHGGWALLRTSSSRIVTTATVGSPTAVDELPGSWRSALRAAAEGRFLVLGFLDDGPLRRLAMASGRTGIAGDFVVYNEVSLLGATAQASGGDASAISGLAVAVYLGVERDRAHLLLSAGELSGRVDRTVVDIGGVEVLLEVAAPAPLAGSLATALPRALLVLGLLLALALAALVEVVARRRDDALVTIRDLEQKNEQLDRALEEQREAEVRRVAMESELRQAQRFEAIGRLAGGVAHDFNNLLGTIISYVDLTADRVADAQARDDLEEIRRAARRGVGLTSQMLQFSERDGARRAPVDVNARVRDLVQMMHRTMPPGVTLDCSLAAEDTTVLGDTDQLDQVLLNLVLNARDAVGDRGTVRLETVRLADDGVEGPFVRVVVRDDGCGIHPADLDHVVEPFFTTKGRGQGTGLGLATAYAVVQRHGGRMRFDSTVGSGTAVEVVLPAALVPDARSPRGGGAHRAEDVVEDCEGRSAVDEEVEAATDAQAAGHEGGLR